MKLFVLAATALVAAPALAQDHSAHAGMDHSAHTTESVAPTTTEIDAAALKAPLTLDTPIETLMANPKARSIVELNIIGIASHPAYEQFKGLSLHQVQPYSNGMITDEMLAKIAAELAALK